MNYEFVQCSKEILGGVPVFSGTRVPIQNMIDYLEAGDSIDIFLEDFPTVKKGQAIQALEFARDSRYETLKLLAPTVLGKITHELKKGIIEIN